MSNNSPSQIISRLMHKDNAYYFRLLGENNLESFREAINKHIDKCKHPFCLEVKRVE